MARTADASGSHWPFERRRSGTNRDIAIKRRFARGAAICGQCWSIDGNHTGKTVANHPLAIQLKAHIAKIAFQQRPPIGHRNVIFGQGEGFIAFGKDQRIKLTKTQRAFAIAAVKARLDQGNPANRGDKIRKANRDADFCDGEIRPRRIADHHIAQSLAFRADFGNVVRSLKIKGF